MAMGLARQVAAEDAFGLGLPTCGSLRIISCEFVLGAYFT